MEALILMGLEEIRSSEVDAGLYNLIHILIKPLERGAETSFEGFLLLTPSKASGQRP